MARALCIALLCVLGLHAVAGAQAAPRVRASRKLLVIDGAPVVTSWPDQATANRWAADTTERAIDAAADGDIPAGAATAVGSAAAWQAANYDRFGPGHYWPRRRALLAGAQAKQQAPGRRALAQQQWLGGDVDMSLSTASAYAMADTSAAIDAAASGSGPAGTDHAARVGAATTGYYSPYY